MVEQLFGSKTRFKLLQLFYSNPNRSYYVREITRKIDEQINSVRRELSNLLSIGIIVSDSKNNRLYYEINQQYQYYAPLHEIFSGGVSKTVKKSSPKDDATAGSQNDLASVGHIELALFTGQFTRDESAGIDLLIVGNVNPNAVQKYVDELEVQENKAIRYSVMSMDDLKYRLEVRDRFAVSIFGAKKQVLVDIHGLLNEDKGAEDK